MDMENTIKNLSDAELLRIINPSLPVMIGEYSVSELLDVAEEEALSIKGIGEAKVKVLIALKEIIHRIMHRAMGSIESIQSPADAIEYFQHLASKPTEETWVLFLDYYNHVIGSKMVARGTNCRCVVGVREIFAPAIKRMAAAIVLAHNHPVGISSPSSEDLKSTKKIVKCSKIIGIQVFDHIIVSKEGSTSLRETRGDLFGK